MTATRETAVRRIAQFIATNLAVLLPSIVCRLPALLAEGLKAWFISHPPLGQRIAALQGGNALPRERPGAASSTLRQHLFCSIFNPSSLMRAAHA